MAAEGDGTVSLEMLFRLSQAIQVEQRETRAELRDMRSLLLAQVDAGRRLERHLTDLRDDLELMLKSELMGSQENLRRQLDRRLGDVSDRLTRLEGGNPYTVQGSDA